MSPQMAHSKKQCVWQQKGIAQDIYINLFARPQHRPQSEINKYTFIISVLQLICCGLYLLSLPTCI